MLLTFLLPISHFWCIGYKVKMIKLLNRSTAVVTKDDLKKIVRLIKK